MPFQYAVIHKRQGWCVLRHEGQVAVYPTFEEALEAAGSLARALSGGGSAELEVHSPTGELRRLSF